MAEGWTSPTSCGWSGTTGWSQQASELTPSSLLGVRVKGFPLPSCCPLSQLSGIALACLGPHAQAVRRHWQIAPGNAAVLSQFPVKAPFLEGSPTMAGLGAATYRQRMSLLVPGFPGTGGIGSMYLGSLREPPPRRGDVGTKCILQTGCARLLTRTCLGFWSSK